MKKSKIIVIFGIALMFTALILIALQFAVPQSVLFSGQYQKTITESNGDTALAVSTDSFEPYSSSGTLSQCDDAPWTLNQENEVAYNKIFLTARRTLADRGCGGGGEAPKETKTYISTQNLTLNPVTLHSIEMTVNYFNSIICPSGNSFSDSGGQSRVYLSGSEGDEILLLETPRPDYFQSSHTGEKRIVVFENLGRFVLDVEGDRKTIDLEDESYELVLWSELRFPSTCGVTLKGTSGGTEKIEITSLSVAENGNDECQENEDCNDEKPKLLSLWEISAIVVGVIFIIFVVVYFLRRLRK